MRYIYIVLGCISMILGVIGIFLPILPTTPFLLLSAFLFGKSSEKFYYFITHNKVLGKYIKDYVERKGITKKNKVISITFMSVGIIYSFTKMNNIYGRVFLIFLFVGVTYHILKIQTVK